MNSGTVKPDPSLPLPQAISLALRPFTASFEVSTAQIADNAGKITDSYSIVVRSGGGGEGVVPIDSVAAVMVCDEELTIDSLRIAYERIKQAKALPKTTGIKAEREMTAGLIVARDSQLPLEQISDEMTRLTALIPSQHWPDAVAVLSKGTINYTAQDPAGIAKAGDFFLPAPSLVGNAPAPSVFVQKAIRGAGDQTFNKVISLVLARIGIFEPGIDIPNFREFITCFPSHGVATETYQFDLACALRVMTVEQAVTARLPQERFEVMQGKEALGSVQFLPWQDGGVLVVRGKFPIEMLLVFLRATKPGINPEHLASFRGPDSQVSFVLPITRQDFLHALAVFQSRSNMRIERRDPKGVVQKFNEGTAVPFIARLMLGVMMIRDAAHGDSKSRNRFDELYEPVLSGLRDAREACKEIDKSWKDHRVAVESGAIARVQRGTIYIDEHIDRLLTRELDSFLNTSVRVIKHGMQSIAEHHSVDIGFLFKKQSAFQTAIDDLRKTDAVLADYLSAARDWSEPLVLMRNNLEHGTTPSPKVIYIDEGGIVRAGEPMVGTEPLTEFTQRVLSRVCCFVEELTIYFLKKGLPQGIDITEQPRAGRDQRAPLRFHLTVAEGGFPSWVPSPHANRFDEV